MQIKIKFSALIILISLWFTVVNAQENWNNWRGPNNDGVALTATPPTQWSETQNVKWKIDIPGKGLSTPVIWGDKLFITTAIELDEEATAEAIKRMKKSQPAYVKLFGMANAVDNFLQFKVFCFDRNSGEILWSKVVREQYPHEANHAQGSWASQSCVTDGQHVIAFFGSFGLYCFDMEGNIVWEKDLGDMNVINAFGESSSPVLYKDKLVILWDHEGESKIHVFNKLTGDEIWQKNRVEATTWATPLVVEVDGKAQIIVNGEVNCLGYDLQTGDIVWQYGGLGAAIIPTPVFDGENAYLMTCFGSSKIAVALKLKGATGILDSTNAVLWTHNDNPSYIPSPLYKDGKLYYLKQSRSQITCVEAVTGKEYYAAQKLSGLTYQYASPLWANGYLYIIDRKGKCAVIKDGTTFEEVSINELDDQFDASPAVVGGSLYLRGHKSLYCISE